MMVLPYNIKKEYLQFGILVLALGLTYYLLLAPWALADSSLVHLVAMFAMFGLAFISIILEYCLAIYKIVPVDLYETGMTIVVEDPALLREIAQRKREQEEMERKLREMEAKNAELERQKNERKKKEEKKEESEKEESEKEDKREDSEMSLAENSKEEVEEEFKPD